MAISFPDQPGLYTPNTTIGFPALVNGVIVNCEISTEALQDHFGARSTDSKELQRAFESGKGVIVEAARKRLEIDADRRCLLVTSDF